MTYTDGVGGGEVEVRSPDTRVTGRSELGNALVNTEPLELARCAGCSRSRRTGRSCGHDSRRLGARRGRGRGSLGAACGRRRSRDTLRVVVILVVACVSRYTCCSSCESGSATLGIS